MNKLLTVRDRVEALAREQGTTISAIEDAAKLGRGTITKWNRSKPSAKTLLPVARYLGVTTGYLLGEEDKKERTMISDADLKFALWRGEEGMTAKQLEEILRFAGFVKERDRT